MKLDSDAVVVCGSSNSSLAQSVADRLGGGSKSRVIQFADGETHVKILDTLTGKDVYIIQPTCPPVNESVMELFLTVSAVKRAGAATVTVVTPYYGYARQDRKHYW